jgi:tetratricopeptide (TPR) repeat protein
MSVRTVTRNPTWLDTFTMLNTLAIEHPESSFALRARAQGFERVGEMEQARQAFELALEFEPDNYQLVVEAGVLYSDLGQHERAEQLFTSAIGLLPRYPAAYVELATQRLLRGEGRGAHAAALSGLARAGSDRELWFLVSESYVAKGDVAAAIHASQAALAQEPDFEPGWSRLAELLELEGREGEARTAGQRASHIPTSRDPGAGA